MSACLKMGDETRLGRVQSVVRALTLLEQLAQNAGMTLTEVARALKLPRSTAHRLLTTMEELQYVEFERCSGIWAIGVQAFDVGAGYTKAQDIGHLADEGMRVLREDLQHHVNISVLDGTSICYVGQAALRDRQQTTVRPGACLPMYTTAAGKAFMAHWSREKVDAFVKQRALQPRTKRSIVDVTQLQRELDQVREMGFALDDEEHAPGLRCVAVPVLDPDGIPRAALSISDVPRRLDRRRMESIGPILHDAAGQMSRDMGRHLLNI